MIKTFGKISGTRNFKHTLNIVAAAVALSAVPVAAAAQSASDLDRQMEVTRAYEPTVNRAEKLDIEPNMVDTVALHPDIGYRITPYPINRRFETVPIKVASISTFMNRDLAPFYLKLGAGYPFQTIADAYYTSTGNPDSRLGAYLNHYGSWSKIENDNKVEAPATTTTNKIGAFGEHRFGQMGVDGEIGYDYDMFSRYGYYTGTTPGIDTTAAGLRQDFSTMRAAVNFGNPFEDLSYLNFRMGADVAYFQDKFNYSELDSKVYLAVGKLFGGKHQLTFRAQYEGHVGYKDLYYTDNAFSVIPQYRFNSGKFDIAFGLNYTYNDHSSKIDGIADNHSDGYLFPKFDIKLDIAGGYFIPYIEIDGRLRNNSYRNTVLRNPYVVQGLFMPSTEEYDGRVGITGNISSVFSYRVFGGVSVLKRMNMFVNMYDDVTSARNLFSYITDDATVYTFGGDLEGRIAGSFGVELALQYFGYDMKTLDKAIGMPDFTGRLGLKYSYRDKFTARAGVGFTGRRYFYDEAGISTGVYDMTKVYSAVNLTLGVEYNISRAFGMFLDLDNLLDHKQYQFHHYPGLGVNGMAGIRLSF